MQFIPYKNSIISYHIFGSGNRLVFCFHGYGEDSLSFSFLEETLGEAFTLIAIDFPFHGKTEWREDLLFSAEDLWQILYALMPENYEKFSLLAYSMGGRVALTLLQNKPNIIDTVALVAPDGLNINFWYWLSTQTTIGNKIFSFTMNHPSWVLWFIKAIEASGLMNKNLIKFTRYFLEDTNERLALYKRWTSMRKFRPNNKVVKDVCIMYGKKLCILLGKRDPVIPANRADFLACCNTVKIKIIDSGHQLMKPVYAADIASLLTQ